MPSRKSKSSKSGKSRDPFAERELEKYANPIPSREIILQELEKIGEPTAFDSLSQRRQISDPEQLEALRRRLTVGRPISCEKPEFVGEVMAKAAGATG